MDLHSLISNINHPPILFFILGLLVVTVKSDLEIPPQIAKFLTLYLLFDIGFKGGVELSKSGFNPTVLKVIIACVLFSFLMPFISYRILRFKLDVYNAGAIAATYGSISAVTYATGLSFLDSAKEPYNGFMTAGMALMESPAIISGLILIRLGANSSSQDGGGGTSGHQGSMWSIVQESLFNGSVFLLIGSLIVGYLTGHEGEEELKSFVFDNFKGWLSLYMLDMGILAAQRFGDLRKSGTFLVGYSLLFPIVIAMLAIPAAHYVLGLNNGNTLLFTILCASASYIAVPAAMRMAVPQVNMSLLLPMALGVTFTFNVSIGIPLYFQLIKTLWP
ncbi:MAG TPA: sodium-dependent bicarbonate transport family permease [Microscillaceae bacterium]|nr:sodium-dependent bicarbonate transport family permease [Microscillaceae bacterium]